MDGRFADNSNFRELERLTVQLHALIAAGEGESDEAEAVRDLMDWPWGRLDAEEVKRLNGLSADLYMLSGEEIHVPAAARTPDDRLRSIQQARASEDAETVVRLLREAPPLLSPHDAAAMRAWAYDQLGHVEVARAFTQFAAELSYLRGRTVAALPFNFRMVAA